MLFTILSILTGFNFYLLSKELKFLSIQALLFTTIANLKDL